MTTPTERTERFSTIITFSITFLISHLFCSRNIHITVKRQNIMPYIAHGKALFRTATPRMDFLFNIIQRLSNDPMQYYAACLSECQQCRHCVMQVIDK